MLAIVANAVSKAVALESCITDSKLYGDAVATPSSNSSSFSPNHRVSHSQPVSTHKNTKIGKCKCCGRSHARGTRQCPAADSTCGSCSKVGHFTAAFLSRKPDNYAHMASERVKEEHANYFCDDILSVSPHF
eukprot:scpid95605/ scgid23337/ 